MEGHRMYRSASLISGQEIVAPGEAFRLIRSISEDNAAHQEHAFSHSSFGFQGSEDQKINPQPTAVRALDFSEERSVRTQGRHSRSKSYHHRPRAHTLLSNVLIRSSLEKRLNKSKRNSFPCASMVTL